MRIRSKKPSTFSKGVVLGIAVAMISLVASAAVAGTGVGKVFNIGESNRVNARSQLEGATPSAVLNVTNSNTSASASGVAIDVPASDPPLVVNSATKVKNLNADLLDGRDGSTFQGVTSESCTNGTAIRSITPNGTATCSTSAVLPIDVSEAPGATTSVDYPPSSLELDFQSVANEGVNLFLTNRGAAVATISYAYDTNGNPATVGNTNIAQGLNLPLGAGQQAVGQFIYYDQTTVTTVNISIVNLNADGAEFHGTVEETLKS